MIDYDYWKRRASWAREDWRAWLAWRLTGRTLLPKKPWWDTHCANCGTDLAVGARRRRTTTPPVS